MFVKTGELKSLKNWWHPPTVPEQIKLEPAMYYQRSLFLWMPRGMYKVALCGRGLYNCVRLVLDLKGYYCLAGVYMYCSLCNGTYLHCLGPAFPLSAIRWAAFQVYCAPYTEVCL